MFDIRIHIHCPDLIAAAELLAGVRASRTSGPPEDRPPSPPPRTQPGEPAVPVTPPTASAPAAGCTVRDVARAGAALLRTDPGLQPRLRALLTRFGARSAMELKPEQLPAFADALRSLGAKL